MIRSSCLAAVPRGLRPCLCTAARWAVGVATLIRIYAAGSTGSESMELEVAGHVVAVWPAVGGNAQAGAFELFEVEVPGPVAPADLRISFLNDDGPRNLRVDRIRIGDQEYQTEAPTVWSTGTWTAGGFVPGHWQSEWLHGKGYFQFAEPGPGPIPGAFGSALISDQWNVVSGEVGFDAPIAIVGPASFRETDPGAISLRTVDPQGFDARFAEWPGEDGPHGAEQVDWLLLPTGRYESNDGSHWEMGRLELDGNATWVAREFTQPFGTRPHVFVSIQTSAGSQPLLVRVRNVTTEGFEAALFTAESGLGTPIDPGTVGYLAIEPAAESGVVTVGTTSFPYRLWNLPVGTEPTAIGSGNSLLLQEDRSFDDEADHLFEDVSVLQLGGMVFAQDQSTFGPDPASLRIERALAGVELPPGFRLRQVVAGSDLEDAVALDVAADGRIFVAEESGRIHCIVDGVRMPEPWLDLSSEVFRAFADEGALSGFVLDPAFASNGYVYALYPTGVEGNTFGRLARFRKSNAPDAGPLDWERKILLGNDRSDGLIHDVFHNVGDLEFAVDGSLFVSWGDAAGNAADDPGQLRAQNLAAPAGKIFRIHPATGHGYRSNPFFRRHTGTWESRVWAYGLRNGFRFAVHPYDSSPVLNERSRKARPGQLYIGDVGRFRTDELNLCRGGENFGWPRYEGVADYRPERKKIRHTPPVLGFPHPDSRCLIVGDFYSGVGWPTAFHGGLLVTDFVEGWLRFCKPDPRHTAVTVVPFGSGLRGVTDMQYDARLDAFWILGRGEDIIFDDATGLDGLFRLEYRPD